LPCWAAYRCAVCRFVFLTGRPRNAASAVAKLPSYSDVGFVAGPPNADRISAGLDPAAAGAALTELELTGLVFGRAGVYRR
jgi:hypothetical protein